MFMCEVCGRLSDDRSVFKGGQRMVKQKGVVLPSGVPGLYCSEHLPAADVLFRRLDK